MIVNFRKDCPHALKDNLMKLEDFKKIPFENLKCENITDRFSVNNNQAKLKYKVGLISIPEYNILGSYTLHSNQDYWTISPYYFVASSSDMRIITSTGTIALADGINKYGVKPVISLRPGTLYTSGDGSMANPYIIETN